MDVVKSLLLVAVFAAGAAFHRFALDKPETVNYITNETKIGKSKVKGTGNNQETSITQEQKNDVTTKK